MEAGTQIIATKGTREGFQGLVVKVLEGDRVYVSWERGYQSSYAIKNIALASIPHKVIPAEIRGMKLIKPKYVKL